MFEHQQRSVSEILIHEKFNKGNLKNDVALLRVQTPFNLQPHVDTICLPAPNQNFDGKLCAATGWGKDRFGELSKVIKCSINQ